MHSVVLFAHPEPDSLTAHVTQQIADGITATGGTTEIADLASEGFDPRLTHADLQVVRGLGHVPDDVRAEQERIERADTLVVVHPVYWWSMPSLLKGWADRVFTFGWAFGSEQATALADKDIHMVRLGGSAPETYSKHGYLDAIRTVVDHGIFEFAGRPLSSTHLLHTAPEGIEQRVADVVSAVTAEAAKAPVGSLTL